MHRSPDCGDCAVEDEEINKNLKRWLAYDDTDRPKISNSSSDSAMNWNNDDRKRDNEISEEGIIVEKKIHKLYQLTLFE
jgi:hypothetical protein